MTRDQGWDAGWVTADGGALDRVGVFCAVLLGLCSALMAAVTLARGAWVAVGFWTLVLGACGVVGWRCLRRVRRVSRRGPA